MDKFAVDLDKVLDELEQSEGLLSERLPEAQLHALDVSGPTAQTNANCLGDVPHQNGDHRIVPPTSVIASTATRVLTDTKKTSNDGVTSDKAYYWDDVPPATVLRPERNSKNVTTHIPTNAAETATVHLQDRVDFPGARTAARIACYDKSTVPVNDTNQSSCLRDYDGQPVDSSRQPSSAAPTGDNALAETCGRPIVPAADSYENDGGTNSYSSQSNQHESRAQVGAASGVPEQSAPCAESRTSLTSLEPILNRVCSDGASHVVLPKSSVPKKSFQGPDLLSLSPVEDSSASKCPEAPKSLISLSPDGAKVQNESGSGQPVCSTLPEDGRLMQASSLLDSANYLPQVEAAMPSSGVAGGTSASGSSELLGDSSLQTVVHLPEALKPSVAVSGDKFDEPETSEDLTSETPQASKPTAVSCPERTYNQSALAPLSACLTSEQSTRDTHKAGSDVLARPTADADARTSGTACISNCGLPHFLSDQSSVPTDGTNLQDQHTAQPAAQDSAREVDASSTSPSEASSALPATPSISPPPKVSPPDPALLSYSPPRSSSAPPGALPASPVRAPSTLSSASSSASAGLPSTDGLDDTVHLEGSAPDHLCTDEATVINEAPCLDDRERVVGFDTAAPDITDEELDQLLREEEGADDEGERNFLPPLSEEEQMLGKVKPFWIPDEEALACMLCFVRFTVLKRRHHCRACGKVLCSSCCNQKAPLPCLENREGRVCLPCLTVLQRVAAVERLGGPSPANPAAYCSRGPPPLQGASQSPPLTVLVPVLRRGPRPDGEAPKQVMFSDGIRPGGDLSDEVVPSAMPGPPRELGCRDGPAESLLQERRVVLSDIEGSLPPVALSASQRDLKLENEADLMIVLQDPNVEPVAFALTRNLHVLVKIVTVECGGARQCWNFCSRGLATLGVDEVVLLLEREAGESRIPRDALRFYATLQGIGATGAHHGAVMGGALVGGGGTATSAASVGAFQPLPFPEGVLGSSDHGGFLLLPHMGQCLDGLAVIPRPPWLCAVLLQRLEMPWARLLPLRLLLRLGAEFEVYPYPMVSVRGRRSVYLEVGHTIMTVLLDFRNFQYQLASLSGLLVHLEGRQTTVRVPRNRYDALVRVLDGNEHVLALAGNLSPEADAHLVCVQAPDAGTYHSQALQARPGSAVEITGASFVVFSGALKGPGEAKHSVVEDGVLVQLSPSSMGNLRTALRAMRDWHVPVVPSAPGEESGHIAVVWTEDDRPKNLGVRSPIDGRSLEGVTGVRLRAFSDFCARGLCLRWTEFFLLSCDGPTWGGCEDPQRAADGLARAFCEALLPHLVLLQPLSPLGLRAQLGPDQVGYEAGAQGQPLPVVCQEPLDCALVPLLSGSQEPMQLEMLFHVIYQ